MALAIDASSPSLATITTTAGSVTTASFTPPAGSQLWVASVSNQPATGTTFSVASSPVLAFTQRVLTNAQEVPAAWHWAPVATSQSYTVTSTRSVADGQGMSVLVRVITGEEDTPGGATATANSNSGTVTTTITTTRDGSLILACSGDWSQSGLATYDANQTNLAEHDIAGQYTSHFWRYNGLPAIGTYTVDLDAPTPQDFDLSVVEIRATGAPATGPTLVADRGSTQNLTGATSDTVGLAAGGSITVGNYLIARVAVDNSGTNGAKPGLTVTDARNTWTVLDPANSLADPGAANAGSACYIAYARAANAYSNADNVTFTWGTGSPPAKAIVVEEWSGIDATSPIAVSAVGATAATSPADISITPTGPGQLVYTCLSTEGPTGDTAPVDSSPTNGAWVTLTRLSTGSGTATSNQTVAGQYNLTATTGVSNQWNPTITARDWAAIAVVFRPTVPANQSRYLPRQPAAQRAATR